MLTRELRPLQSCEQKPHVADRRGVIERNREDRFVGFNPNADFARYELTFIGGFRKQQKKMAASLGRIRDLTPRAFTFGYIARRDPAVDVCVFEGGHQPVREPGVSARMAYEDPIVARVLGLCLRGSAGKMTLPADVENMWSEANEAAFQPASRFE